jgi:hypothetical protein
MTGPRTILICGLLAASLSVSAAADPATGEIKPYTASHALVIGNDAYRDPWPRLNNAAKDAQLVAGALRAKGFDVTQKTDLGASALKDALATFFATHGGEAGGRLVVWFSGHGLAVEGEGFLIPVDAPASGGRVSLDWLGEYLRQVESRHVLVVLNAAVGPTILRSVRALPPPPVTSEAMQPARQIIVSGDAGQAVADDGRFRDLFVAALEGRDGADANGDGYLTAREIGRHVTDRIAVATQGRQTPRYGILADDGPAMGDFIFTLATPTRHFIVLAATSIDAETLAHSLNPYQAEVSAMKSLAGRLFRVRLTSARSEAELLAILRDVPGVREAEADATVTPRTP